MKGRFQFGRKQVNLEQLLESRTRGPERRLFKSHVKFDSDWLAVPSRLHGLTSKFKVPYTLLKLRWRGGGGGN